MNEEVLWPGYDTWQLVKIKTPDDNHHLFHAICQAFFKPYIDEEFNGCKISKLQVVLNLRKELADKLGQFIPGKGLRYYDLYKSDANASLLQTQSKLASTEAITFGYFNYLSHQINKDIFILQNDGTLYPCDELVYKNRTAIILYYHNHHFDVVGIKNDNHIQTHFRPTHDLIQHLSKMIQ